MIERAAALVLLAGAAFAGMFQQESKPAAAVSYPRDYRNWAHVKTALIGPSSPFFATVGGLHHIYANDKAKEGYASGRFPDGSVLVFDVLEARESEGTTVEGPRRLIDVMEKDSQRFAATGGWGFAEFKGDNQTEQSLTAEAAKKCHSCHATAQNHDLVFSKFRR